MSDSLELKSLVQELKSVQSRWDILGIQLGFTLNEIEEIKLVYRYNNERTAISMYDRWLKKEVNPSWLKITTALEKMSERSLASQLKKKYGISSDHQATERLAQQQDESPQTTMCEKPIPKPRSRLVSELKVDRKDQVVQDLECLKAKYFELVTNAELALKTANLPVEKLKRFSQIYMKDQVVTTVEELFDCLGQLCFLDYALLESVITVLLKKSQSVVDDLNDYVQQLYTFKKSTTLHEFMESIERVYSSLTTKGAGVCTVKIRLVGSWLEKTMEDLDRLLKEIFQDKASILASLKIVRGSVIIICLAPQSETASIIRLARAMNSRILISMGVHQVFVGQKAVFSAEPEFYSFEFSLISSVVCNKIKLLKFLLDIKTDSNAANKEWTALMYGSYRGHDEAVRTLLKANANPNLQATDGLTPLFIAANRGHFHVANTLLKAKANPNLHKNGLSPLFIAAYHGQSAIVDILLHAHANPNLPFYDGSTPLFVAAQNRCYNTVKLLLSANADPNLTNLQKISPIFMASQFGHTQVVQILLDCKADPNLQRDDGASPLYIAAFMGHAATIGVLLNANAKPDLQAVNATTPIYMAAQNGHSDIVYLLLVANANPNLSDDLNTTPLFVASQFGHTRTVNILLHANANPNLKRIGGSSPLHPAAFKGYCDIVSSLLKAKANPDIQTNDGSTPLYMAAKAGHSDIVNVLLKANANPNLKNKQGVTPLCIASQGGHSDAVRILLNANADPNVQANNSTTPLMSACLNRCPAVVHLLLENRANPNLRHSEGTTALMLASHAGCYESVELLLKYGADPNIHAAGPKCLTAFSIAAFSGHDDIADLLKKSTKTSTTDSQRTNTTEITRPDIVNTNTGTKTTETVTATENTSVDIQTTETVNTDKEAIEMLNKAAEAMSIKKVEAFILALIDKSIQSKPVQEPKIIFTVDADMQMLNVHV